MKPPQPRLLPRRKLDSLWRDDLICDEYHEVCRARVAWLLQHIAAIEARLEEYETSGGG